MALATDISVKDRVTEWTVSGVKWSTWLLSWPDYLWSLASKKGPPWGSLEKMALSYLDGESMWRRLAVIGLTLLAALVAPILILSGIVLILVVRR